VLKLASLNSQARFFAALIIIGTYVEYPFDGKKYSQPRPKSVRLEEAIMDNGVVELGHILYFCPALRLPVQVKPGTGEVGEWLNPPVC
jgi:hypothetical protein